MWSGISGLEYHQIISLIFWWFGSIQFYRSRSNWCKWFSLTSINNVLIQDNGIVKFQQGLFGQVVPSPPPHPNYNNLVIRMFAIAFKPISLFSGIKLFNPGLHVHELHCYGFIQRPYIPITVFRGHSPFNFLQEKLQTCGETRLHVQAFLVWGETCSNS